MPVLPEPAGELAEDLEIVARLAGGPQGGPDGSCQAS